MLMDGISNVWLEQQVGDDIATSYLRTVDMVCHTGPCEDYVCSLFKTNCTHSCCKYFFGFCSQGYSNVEMAKFYKL